MRDTGFEAGVRGIILAFLLVILFLAYVLNESHWNDGHCSCGGNWVYQQAVGHRYTTYYLYECDKCGKTYEFHEKR